MENYIDCCDIVNHLDIQKDDRLFISSDVVDLFITERRIKKKFPDIHQFIDSFVRKVGPSGTVIFPTYNWGFCRGESFDIRTTPCKTGILGQAALEHPGFKRTKHPIYSFAVMGKDQEYLCSLNNKSSFGPDSPFAYFDDKKIKNLIIGIPIRSCYTFCHYVEEKSSAHVKYRFLKDFTSNYIDEQGVASCRTYSMFVRYLDKDVVSNGLMDYDLFKLGIAKETILNGVTFTMVDMHASVKPITDDILYNRSRKLCNYKGQEDE